MAQFLQAKEGHIDNDSAPSAPLLPDLYVVRPAIETLLLQSAQLIWLPVHGPGHHVTPNLGRE